MRFIIKEDIAKYFNSAHIFSEIMKLEGTIHRSLQNRKTLDFYLGEKHFFVKLHQGVGYQELIKNFFFFRKAVVDATLEWKAINAVKKMGVETLDAVGFGCKGWNPATRKSFLITIALEKTVPLDLFCAQWKKEPPTVCLKRVLIDRVASMISTLHSNGYVHRDCYLCHFLLNKESIINKHPRYLSLTLIDLHRATQVKFFSERWFIKDLAALYFSSREIGLTKRDIYRFLKKYYNISSVKTIFQIHEKKLKKILKKAQNLVIKFYRKFKETAEAQTGIPLINPNQIAKIKNDKKFPAGLLLQDDLEWIICTKLFRLAKGKRMVLLAEWRGRPVVIKVYCHPIKSFIHFYREYRGVKLLQKSGISTPKCLYAGKCFGGGVRILVFEYIERCVDPKNYVNLDLGLEFLRAAVPMLAKMHESGIIQKDLHPHNYLFSRPILYAIDGSDVYSCSKEFKEEQTIPFQNLALLIAQFPAEFLLYFDELYQLYCQSRHRLDSTFNQSFLNQDEFFSMCSHVSHKRNKALAKKALRASTGILEKNRISSKLLFREEWEQEILFNIENKIKDFFRKKNHTMIKAGNSATVIETMWAGVPIIVKRYNIKSMFHCLKNSFKKTRAKKSWQNAQLLIFLNIPTASPIACFEKRVGVFFLESYFIMNKIKGVLLDKYMQTATDYQKGKIIEQAKDIFYKLKYAQIIHGDYKATNFLVADEILFLIDLDSMHFISNKKQFEKEFKKDMCRFEKNWQGEPEIGAFF